MADVSWLGGLASGVGNIVGSSLNFATSKRGLETAKVNSILNLQLAAGNNQAALEQSKIQQATALKIVTYAGIFLLVALLVYGFFFSSNK